MQIIGIDEAGKGACIGPLVVAAVKINEEANYELKKIGVKDSKLLTPYQREILFKKIIQIAVAYKIMVIEVEELNRENLTKLQIEKIKILVDLLKPYQKIIIDKIGGLKEENFLRLVNLESEVKENKVKIVYKKGADKEFEVVAAAAILAKVKRDRTIKALGYNDISGYPNLRTEHFIREYILKEKKLPAGVRIRWKNIKRL